MMASGSFLATLLALALLYGEVDGDPRRATQALLHGRDSAPAQASTSGGMSLRIEPQVACPQAQFDVIWEKQQAQVDHWVGVFLDHKLLYWCFLDGTQTQPLELGDSTGVGLVIGTPGTYSVHYFATPRPKGTTPVLMQDAIGEARVTISSVACFEVNVHPTTSCELDPFELSWKIPAGKHGKGDRIGIFRAEDGAAVPGLPTPPPPPALHWVPVTEATGKKVLRIGKPGQFEARFFFGTAPTIPDFASKRFHIVQRSDPGCGDYIGVSNSAASTPDAAVPLESSTPTSSEAHGALPPPLMMILHSIAAVPSTRHIKVPDANLGLLPTGVPSTRLPLSA
jgi:hypothetical protein